MTVEEALQLSVLKGAKVLTPPQALADKQITWVSVIEVPVEEFIRSGEFVLSTCMNIGHDATLLTRFVKDVARGSPAALAISIGPYTPSVPRQAVREAVRQKLTLIEIPWKVRFSEISEAILRRLMHEQISSRSLDEFVWSLITNSTSEEDAIARGRQFGYSPKTRYVAIAGRVKGRTTDQLPEQTETAARLTRELCDRMAQSSRLRWLGTAAGDSIFGFLEIAQSKQNVRAWLMKMNAHVKTTAIVSWGIGRVCSEFRDLQASHQDASVACDIGRVGRDRHSITDVSDVLGDRVLMKLKQDADALLLMQRYLDPLRRARRMELIETLEKYFENDCGAAETARRLGISRQALLYRLTKAQALLDCDFESYAQRFAIALSLRLDKLNKTSV